MAKMLERGLSGEERSRYERDGFVVREGLISVEEIAELSEAVEKVMADLVAERRNTRRAKVGSYTFEPDVVNRTTIKWEEDSDVVLGIEPMAHLHPTFQGFADDPRFTEPMSDLIGSNEVCLFTEKLNLKRAGRGGPIVLHQDHPYWSSWTPEVDRTFTALLALDDATIENGALEVIPGSHHWGPLAGKQSDDAGASKELDEAQVDVSGIVPVEMPAGSVVFFGSLLVHRSPPNRSRKDRRALLYSYQPAGLPHALELLHREQERAKASDE